MTQTIASAQKKQGKTLHMPKIELEIGSKMLVRLGWGAEDASKEMTAELIGCLHYEYIVLRILPNPGLLSRLIPGTQARVRFLHDGAASEFNVSVLSYIVRPSLLIFLSYPESMNSISVRQFQRLQSRLPAVLFSSEGAFGGTIGDVSMGGCQLVADIRGQAAARNIQSGSGGTLQVCLKATGNPSKVNCVLRNVEIEHFQLSVGLAFDPEDKVFRKDLEEYLELVRSSFL
ncbi:MAG: flagellar brake protein [Deltaproteobacteria bacterium]|nr:flagellar brake protein [Deltaproteobacteria bacterium]